MQNYPPVELENLFRQTISLAVAVRERIIQQQPSRARDLAVGIITEAFNLDWRVVYNPNINHTPRSLCGSIFLAVVSGLPESETLMASTEIITDTMENIIKSGKTEEPIHPVLLAYEKSWGKGQQPKL